MEHDKKLKFAKKTFEMLKTDPLSAAFPEETLDKKLLKKTYLKVKVYLTLQIKFQTLINLKKNIKNLLI